MCKAAQRIILIVVVGALFGLVWLVKRPASEAVGTVIAGAWEEYAELRKTQVLRHVEPQMDDFLVLVIKGPPGTADRELRHLAQAANGGMKALRQLPSGTNVALYGVCGTLWRTERFQGVPQILWIRWSVRGEGEWEAQEFLVSGAIFDGGVHIACS